MRKISILSLIAVLSVTPMMAEAARTVTKENYSAPTANTNVASTSYVQGAYKAAADRIDALVDDTAVAAKADGEPAYVAVSASSTVGENLAALDSAIANASSAAATDVTTKINALNATVSQTTGDINISVAEQSGVLTSVTANIINSAVTTDKIGNSAVTTAKIEDDAVTADKIAQSAVTTSEIADGTILVTDMNASAVVTAEDGIASSATASDDKLVTEAAVRSAIDTINTTADNLASVVGDKAGLTGDAAGASTIVAAINAVDNALNNKRLEVFTTWNSAASSEIALSAATGQ